MLGPLTTPTLPTLMHIISPFVTGNGLSSMFTRVSPNYYLLCTFLALVWKLEAAVTGSCREA